MTEMEEQRKKAIEMGGHLKDLAATYDLEDDRERHLLKCLAEAYIQQQTKYEYMRLQADMSNTPPPLHPPLIRGERDGSGGELTQRERGEFFAGAQA